MHTKPPAESVSAPSALPSNKLLLPAVPVAKPVYDNVCVCPKLSITLRLQPSSQLSLVALGIKLLVESWSFTL